MNRFTSALGLAALLVAAPTLAADLSRPVPTGNFRATCEDLGTVCFADACGRDQIDAAQGCQARCPSAVVMSVVPETCPLPVRRGEAILRRRG
ncbi:hypothetical protein [Methylobacterium sp. J-076]|uniref:hypothetical protein n=1 Tax=Methylobacterium sp. J-076 TaxID=2836655 RepID=UPI001FBB642D|nr:hypothetical protein [Methylobacterium sp. J-076]MCJ2012098.1 hypothetical protein [Methylobacterium sp. J-076]